MDEVVVVVEANEEQRSNISLRLALSDSAKSLVLVCEQDLKDDMAKRIQFGLGLYEHP